MRANASVGEELYDLIIIGAGPAGLSASTFARTKNLTTLILEANQAGGQTRKRTSLDFPLGPRG